MAWFSFLKSEGYFDPENNPEPFRVKQGWQTPYWAVLSYLEKLSMQIGQGNETELTDELLEVIKNVSEHPKDNYKTWYVFIKILSNLPNEKIPVEILNFIPVWLGGNFDTMLQTSEITKKLLPKFLNDTPTSDDIEKVELILHYLFQVEKSGNQDDIWDGDRDRYRSRIYLHFLYDEFERKDLSAKVVKHCSSRIILELGRTIKFLLIDYPKGIKSIVKEGKKEFEIKIYIEKENLLVSSKLIGNEVANTTGTLKNWEDKNETELKRDIVSILNKQRINYKPNDDKEDTFKKLKFALNTDLSSPFGFNSIRKLDNHHLKSEKVLNVFSLIFRNLLVEKARQNPKEAISLLETFCFDNKYRITFFKRISLYVICENWNSTKLLFWKMIEGNDPLHLFSLYKYQKELFDLLNRNQKVLKKGEKDILLNIIDKGDQSEAFQQDESQKEYWQLRWYSALRDVEPFKEKYLSLSKKLNISNEHYENLGELVIRRGSVSPISKDELLAMSNQEITEYIKAFKPKDEWEDPNISGLSDILGSAVESEPGKFALEIEMYQNIGYIYSYRMLNAFGEAWKKKRVFDWEKVLGYCLNTLNCRKFYSGELKLENDTYNATAEWVVDAIAQLISYGLQDDKNSFDSKLLPLAKEIVQIIVSKLKRVDDFKELNMDYPTYSLNSTAGKSLKALLDYSLYIKRNHNSLDSKGKWEPEMQSLFESALEKGIIDAYILEGMYFRQFYFLNKDWITEQVKQHCTSEEREWLSFFGSFAIGNPPFNKDIYTIFYPHYQRIFKRESKLENLYTKGLVRHLTAFYFWKYESLSFGNLLFNFLKQSSPDDVNYLIGYIRQHEEYQNNLSELEQVEFQEMVLKLWKFLADKYENSSMEEEQKNLAMLAKWIVFAPELNETYTQLILKSCRHMDKTYSMHGILEYLVELTSKGNPRTAANAIGEIIISLDFKVHLTESDKDFIIDLVLFLFAHGQSKIAAEFCNKMASEYQHFFLREVYEAKKVK